jgi:hypothetical protein
MIFENGLRNAWGGIRRGVKTPAEYKQVLAAETVITRKLHEIGRSFPKYDLMLEYVKECFVQQVYGRRRHPNQIKPPVFENVSELDVVLCRIIDDVRALECLETLKVNICGDVVIEFLKRLFEMFVPRYDIGHCDISDKAVVLEALDIVGSCEPLGYVLGRLPTNVKKDFGAFLVVRGQAVLVPDDDAVIISAALHAPQHYLVDHIVDGVPSPRAASILAAITKRDPSSAWYIVDGIATRCPTALPFIDLKRIRRTYEVDEDVPQERRVQKRLLVLHMFKNAWMTHGGKTPQRRSHFPSVNGLVKTLTLRRICRTVDVDGAGGRMLEPFGQGVVAFL